LGTPRLLIDPRQTTLLFDRGTDIASDGRRFVGVRQVETEEADRVENGIHVVLMALVVGVCKPESPEIKRPRAVVRCTMSK
jgi:hypothetical protein